MTLLQQLPPLMQIALIGLIASFALYMIGGAAAALRRHTQNTIALTVLDIVERAAKSAVAYVDQTLVKRVRVGGKLSDADAYEAAKLALTRVKEEIGQDVLAQLTKQIRPDAPDEVLRVKIEQAVSELKAATKSVPVNVVNPS